MGQSIWCECEGQFLFAQAVARVFFQQSKPGVLINMSSESGQEGSEGQSVYAATKRRTTTSPVHGRRNWVNRHPCGRSGSRHYGDHRMRNLAYEESLAYTRGISVDELRSKYGSVSSIPLGRSGKLSEVADLVVYLASDRASYLHGTTVNLSGGKSRG